MKLLPVLLLLLLLLLQIACWHAATLAAAACS
jgi:cell division protein FtsB